MSGQKKELTMGRRGYRSADLVPKNSQTKRGTRGGVHFGGQKRGGGVRKDLDLSP